MKIWPSELAEVWCEESSLGQPLAHPWTQTRPVGWFDEAKQEIHRGDKLAKEKDKELEEPPGKWQARSKHRRR